MESTGVPRGQPVAGGVRIRHWQSTPPPGRCAHAATIKRQELLSALPEKLASLPPESQQRVKDSLRAVQTAMKNIEAELGRDSGNALLQELLISTCQEEIRVLTAVSDAGGPNQEI
jgi:hypothetical protein